MSVRVKSRLLFICVAVVIITCQTQAQTQPKEQIGSANSASWKAGVAKVKITPEYDMWMAGYAARDKPSEGKLHDLWAKALALEDEQGNRALFVTTDLIGLSRDISKVVCDQIQENHQLQRSQIILTSSHTHSGPVVNSNLTLIYPTFSEEQVDRVKVFREFLKESIVTCTDQALNKLVPARLSSGQGIARFAVNRRNNTPEEVLYSNDLKGPSDRSVPLISVHSTNGNLMTLLFGYACHCTTLSNQQWNGDYAGFAQIELENRYPGCTAMFYASCAGDQNPEPRGLVAQAEQYGTELAAAITTVLKGEMKALNPALKTNYGEIELDFSDPYTIDELKAIAHDSPDWQQRWARHYMTEVEGGAQFSRTYPGYPVQTWQLGDKTVVALGGEVVVDYAIRLKKSWGNDLFIAAYANDVMAYIPSERVLSEGGYEGNTSMRAYGHAAIWATGIEEKIIREVDRQMVELGKTKFTP